jgi:microcystin degradation protein MlrC
MKIYVGGISTETNSFSPINMDIEQFKKGFWLLGEDIRKVKSTTKETRGTLDYLDAQDDVEIAYGFVAHGVTSGPLKSSDYHFMSDLLIQTLEDAMPVDGVVLNMHGAMQSEDCFDCEGNIFVRIRKIVGSNVPIVSSFDLHACITPEMVSSLDGIASFRTYPHTDHADAGFRAAEACVHLAREKIQPGKLLFSLPMIMPVENCNTGEGPIVPIMAMTDRLLADQDVFSGSLNLTQPWLDVPDLLASEDIQKAYLGI